MSIVSVPRILVALISVLFAIQPALAESRIWTDVTGKHHIEAELVIVDNTQVTLQKKDGSRQLVPLTKLSEADRKLALAAAGLQNGVNQGDNRDAAKDAANGDTPGAATFDQLNDLIGQQRRATIVLSLLEGFLAADGISLVEKKQAQDLLPEWRSLAARDCLRVGKDWVTPAEYQQMKDDEKRLLKEAHRLIDIKNDELARDKFLEASQVHRQEVRADFYLGLLNALVAHYPLDAQRHFKECVDRLLDDEDLLVGARKANLVAALNNLAIIQVRQSNHRAAISNWRRALRLEPFTPELVQNLGRMAKLAQLGEVRIGKPIRDAAGELYAQITVQHSLARFDDSVGWLFIPYIDTVDGSMDSDGDEELIPIGGCTGFSVGGNLLLTSRFPVEDADAIAIYGGGPAFSNLKGKIVALSGQSNLALVRFEGLSAKPLPLNRSLPRPAQDVLILGYGQLGLGSGIHSRTATILNPPALYRSFAGVVQKRVDDTTKVSVPMYANYAFRNKIVHDAVTNPGLEGAPLLDANGTVIGVHIGNRREFGRFGSKHSFAEPIEWVEPFLVAVGGNFDIRELPPEPNKVLSPNELEQLGEGSIFQLVAQRRAPRLEWSHRIEAIHRAQKQGAWTSYEDNTCMACNGRGKLECPVRLCARGKVPKSVSVEIARDERTGSVINANRRVFEKCANCDGAGLVDCPHCN